MNRRTSLDPMPPKKEPRTQRSVGLTSAEWERVEAIVAATGQTQSEVVRHFVLWALQELDRSAAGDLHPEASRVLELVQAHDDKLADRIRKSLRSR